MVKPGNHCSDRKDEQQGLSLLSYLQGNISVHTAEAGTQNQFLKLEEWKRGCELSSVRGSCTK